MGPRGREVFHVFPFPVGLGWTLRLPKGQLEAEDVEAAGSALFWSLNY